MKLVIISGPEATGKTFIGKSIAELLKCQYIGKDMIKESLFDSESHSTWNYSWYENKAKGIFFDKIEDFIKHDETVVIESNFIGPDKKHLVRLLNDKIVIVEIFCTSKGLTSFMRFVKRNEKGMRHRGHHDRRWYLSVLLDNLLRYIHINLKYRSLNFSRKLLIIDSTDFSKIDFGKIKDFIA